MDDKSLIVELTRENERLRMTLQAMRNAAISARSTTTTPQQYMSGRWIRRSGDVYGVSIQGDGVTDANSPPGNLRPTD
jgi:hypothetical protein